MAGFDFKAIAASVFSWRGAAGTVITGLGALVVWLIAQVNSLGDTVDRYVEITKNARVERNAYAAAFREGDPTKGDFLNDVVYRVRMGVIEPEAGANLLCWLAARSSSGAEPGSATAGANIISFLDAHRTLFKLQVRGGMPWSTRSVDAMTYCGPYLSTLKDATTRATDEDRPANSLLVSRDLRPHRRPHHPPALFEGDYTSKLLPRISERRR